MNIGTFTPDNNIFLAPMAGVTDKCFRVICKEFGAGLVYTEMISSKGLYYGSKKTDLMLDIDDIEAPAAIQVFGSDPEIMGNMVEAISQNEKVAIIDINMGCPAPKIVKNGEGSALMKDIHLAEKIIKKVVSTSSKPVTVKIRKGWDDNSVNALDFAKMIEASGAAALAIHGRTRCQMYEGKADWNIIRIVKDGVKIPVIGNGDVKSPEDAKNLLQITGCDALMIGRGALGNPWIFKRTINYLNNGEITPEPSAYEKIDMAIKHLEIMDEVKGYKGIIEMRKHIAWYLKGIKDAAIVRDKINKMDNALKIKELLYEHKCRLQN